jgi:hypothetical protein
VRLIVGLHEMSSPAAVADELRGCGATQVDGPTPTLPGVLVAEIPETAAEGAAERASALAGVRYAEWDAPRTIQG